MTSTSFIQSESKNHDGHLRKTKSIDAELWSLAAALGDSHVYPPGVQLLRQGSVAEEIYLIDAGLAKLVRLEENGRELVLGLRLPGSLLGSAAAIHRRSHPFSAVSVISCTLIRVRAQAFLDLLSSNSRLSLCLHHVLSDEILDQAAHMSEIACLSARQRLEHLLWQVAEQLDENLVVNSKFQLPLKHWEAAQLLAITPTYLSRLLAELESEEIISRRDGWIVLRKPASLWHRFDFNSSRFGSKSK